MQRSAKAKNLAKAQTAFDDIFLAIEVDYNLTRLELLHILNTASQHLLKYGVHEEWDGNECSGLDPGRQANGD